jgi:hypothetical protein
VPPEGRIAGGALQFQASAGSPVVAELFTCLGSKVATLMREARPAAGAYSLDLSTNTRVPGLYLVRLQQGARVSTLKYRRLTSDAVGANGSTLMGAMFMRSGAAAVVDTLVFSLQGYTTVKVPVSAYTGAYNAALAPSSGGTELIVWDGETHNTGSAHSISGGATVARTTQTPAHSGTACLRFLWPDANVQSYTGWQWGSPVDITSYTTLVFWVKVTSISDGLLPNKFFVYLRTPSSEPGGAEHVGELFMGIVEDGPTVPASGKVSAPGFADGQWHEVRIPLADMCNNDEHGPGYQNCSAFDKTQANEFVWGFFSVDPGSFVFLMDDIGFDMH